MNTTSAINTVSFVAEPEILTANTYFWTPSSNASSRRRAEERRQAEVAAFFTAIGMDVRTSGDNVIGVKGDVEATFHYSESCKNVYKSLSVTRDGKKSNIKTLRNLLAAVNAPAAIAA